MLNNKTIVVLGAGGRIGRALVEHLCQFPVSILAVGNESSPLAYTQSLVSQSASVDTEILDVTDPEVTQQFFAKQKKIDGLVNCTYPTGANYGRHFLEQTAADFNDNINQHLGSAFVIMQNCANYFKRHQRPLACVNVASIYGVVAPKFQLYEGTSMTMPVEYAAIKAAIIHLTKYFAKAMASSEFRVNVVSPGGIEDGQSESFQKAYQQQCVDNGLLNAQEVCGALTFLLSDHAAAINGQNIIVDNGFTL